MCKINRGTGRANIEGPSCEKEMKKKKHRGR